MAKPFVFIPKDLKESFEDYRGDISNFTIGEILSAFNYFERRGIDVPTAILSKVVPSDTLVASEGLYYDEDGRAYKLAFEKS